MSRTRRKPKKRTRDKVLLFLGIFAVAFILSMIVTYWRFQSVPDTLIQYTLGAGGLEAFLLAGITITDKIRGEDAAGSEDNEDE